MRRLFCSEAVLVVLYVLTVTLTTSISGSFGSLAAVIDSLPGIGLVIAIRNRLQELWECNGLSWKMTGLVFAGSLGSLSGNLVHPRVAVASGIAFAAANFAAALLYRKSKPGSIVAFAVVDSFIFPPLAFGYFVWWVFWGQVGAKIVGAAIWTWILGPCPTARSAPNPP